MAGHGPPSRVRKTGPDGLLRKRRSAFSVMPSPLAGERAARLIRGRRLGLYGDAHHLDLSSSGPAEQEAEVERLVSLRAERVPDWPYPENPDFVVLGDPEGNLFCVLDHD